MGRVIGSGVILGLLISQQYLGCKPLLAASAIRITTCTLAAEDATVNNRSEMVYYTCSGENWVTFVVHQGSTGDLRLREGLGRISVMIEREP